MAVAMPSPSPSLSLHTPVFRLLGQSDMEALGALAAEIWQRHYPGIIPQAQIDYMLARMYAPEVLRTQLAAGQTFWQLEKNGQACGFAAVEPRSDGRWFLHKCYIHPQHARQGLGRALLAHIERTHRPQQLALHVNRGNIQAINFYFAQGFTIRGLSLTEIGGGFVMDDFEMMKQL